MKEHVIELLSPYVDGQLPDADRRMVESHIEKCEACGQELKDLKGLTALLAGTPRSALPTGFRQRLERRRLSEESGAAEKPRLLLPMPARLVAFSVPAILVCIVGYDALKGPGSVEDRIRQVAPLSAIQEGHYLNRASLAKPAALRGASADGGAAAGFSSATPEDALAAAPPVISKKEARAAGSPLGFADMAPAAGPAGKVVLSNDELREHLDKESRKMGIQEVIPPGQAARRSEQEAAEAAPMTTADAREYMRTMAESLARQRMNMDNYHEPIALGKGSQPILLKPQETAGAAGAPIGAEEKSAAREGAVGGVRGMSGGGGLQAAAGMSQAPVTVVPYSGLESDAAENRPSPAYAQKTRSRLASNAAKRSAAAPSSLPAPAAAAAPSEAALKFKADKDSGPRAQAARSVEELKQLWKSLKTPGEPPAVDFSSEMVVAVSAPSAVEIVKVWASGRRLVVEYRLLTDADGPNSTFRVVPLSDLPPSLQLVK